MVIWLIRCGICTFKCFYSGSYQEDKKFMFWLPKKYYSLKMITIGWNISEFWKIVWKNIILTLVQLFVLLFELLKYNS